MTFKEEDFESCTQNPRIYGIKFATSIFEHTYFTVTGPNGEKAFEAYAQQDTPGAYRIFWYYGPADGVASIISIVPHP